MIITPVKTKKIRVGTSLFDILDTSLPPLQEQCIVAVTSKIISICNGDVRAHGTIDDKRALIRSESQWYLEDECLSKYGIILTIKDNTVIASGGIDESNGDGYYILWPKNVHQRASEIWHHLRKTHRLTHVGVLITDSHTTPLRWGTTGIGISWCGFKALKDYRGTPDIFGRPLRVTKASVLDGLAAAAVVAMGEGNEQTPLALINEVPFVSFQTRAPTPKEISNLAISMEEDIFSPLICSPKWRKGGA